MHKEKQYNLENLKAMSKGAMFTGSTVDGSDILQTGMYLHPNGTSLSNMPWSDEVWAKYEDEEQRKARKEADRLEKLHKSIPQRDSWLEEYKLIKAKKSTLSRAQRDYIVQFIESRNYE